MNSDQKEKIKEKIIKMKIKKPNILIVLIGVLLILTSVNLYWTISSTNRLISLTEGGVDELRGDQPQGLPGQQPRVEINIDDNDPITGGDNALITIVEFSDFRCGFCARAKPTTAQILETYGDRVRLVFRNFPILGPESQKVAEAAECANEQGRFWEYRNTLFANQQGLDDINNLKRFAADLRLNTARFNDCLTSGRMADEVERDSREGQGYGVTGTPAFFINGLLVSGAQPYSEFERIIEQELAK